MTGPGPGGLTNPKAINHLIPIADAAAMTARSRKANPGSVRAWLFDRGALDALLAQPGCAGIRIYRAQKEDGGDQVVLVATDNNATDLGTATAVGPGLVAEIAWPCPPICGGASALGA